MKASHTTPEERLLSIGLTTAQVEAWKVAEDKITFLHSIPAYVADNKVLVSKINGRVERNEKRRERRITKTGSQFNYGSCGGMYVPTRVQYLAAMQMTQQGIEVDACQEVIYAYNAGETTHHDNIHVVNVFIRSNK